tara:strand:- start:189 stop:971 length:783 start_codon:yes stop_codon:yes gene_type:complete
MSDGVQPQPSVPKKDAVVQDEVLTTENESEVQSIENSGNKDLKGVNPSPDNQVSAEQASQTENTDASIETSRPLDNEARLEQLEKEHETLRSQYMRIAADFDNFRKRQSRDNDDLKLQLTCTTLSEILPVVDNFERARQQLDPKGEEAQALHRSYQGLYKQLVEVLKQLGVAPMRVVGQNFDPSLHEAVLREPSNEQVEDIILEELQRGYHLNGRVLRHALVKVSMGPGSSAEKENLPQSNEDVPDSSSVENQDPIDSEN